MTEKNIRWYMLGFTLLYIFPIILANKLYLDDVGRSTTGWTFWEGIGRPLSSLIMQTLNFSSIISDLSPITTLASGLLIVYSGWVYCSSSPINYNNWQRIVISLSFLISPFLLQALSFKYDALPMSASIFLASFASSLNVNKKINFAIIIILIFAMNCTYQSALNVYIGLIFVRSFEKYTFDGAIPFSFIIRNAAASILSLLAYMTIIPRFFVTSTYAIEHSKILNISSIREGELISNIINIYNYAWSSLSLDIKFIIFSIIVMSFLSVYNVRKENKSIYNIIAFFVFAILVIASISGPIALLKNTVLQPRVFMGTIPFFAFLTITNIQFFSKYKIAPALLSMPFLLTSYAYGNALTIEEKFGSTVITRLGSALELSGFSSKDKLIVIGHPPKPQPIRTAALVRPIIGRMALGNFSAGWAIRDNLNRYQAALPGQIIALTPSINNDLENTPAEIDGPLFRLKIITLPDYKLYAIIFR